MKRLSLALLVLIFLVTGLFQTGIHSVQAQLDETPPCVPGSGWRWTAGPSLPEMAERARQALAEQGIIVVVKATGYGEVDSCGAYQAFGVDFILTTLEETPLVIRQDPIRAALAEAAGARIGRIVMEGRSGEQVLTSAETPSLSLSMINGWVAKKNVYVVIYNPMVDENTTLIEYLHWNSPEAITTNTVNFFTQASAGRVQYNVVSTTVLDEFPVKLNGFRFDVPSYLSALGTYPPTANMQEMVNYNAIVNDPRLDICGKANRNEIDEVWMYNGPWFGFWESTLVGPGSYWYNSSPVPGPWTCTRMIPIMGPSPERFTPEAVENFGHRTESTMARTYQGIAGPGGTSNNWQKFSMCKAWSGLAYSGCGNIHFPPNGAQDYDWGNPAPAQTYCEDFRNYPNLSEPASVLQTVTCTTWKCNGLDYFQWWFSHFPSTNGCGPDKVANTWWKYFANPALALDPDSACTLDYSVYLPVTRR